MEDQFSCKTCPFIGPVDAFSKDPRRKTPFECKECKRVRSRRHYGKNKVVYSLRSPRRRFEARELVTRLKSEPCTDCGKSFHYCQMDFDHRVPAEKKLPISRMQLLSLDTIRSEIAKCDLVCANCHRLRSWNRQRALRAGES